MRIVRNIVLTGAIIIIFASVALNITYYIFNLLPNKNKLFSNVVSQILKQPVQIKQAEIAGYWWEPIIVLQDATIGRVHLRQVQISLDLIDMLIHQKWETDQIAIDHLQLQVMQNAKNHFSVLGISSNAISISKKNKFMQNIIAWLSSEPDIIFSNTQIEIIKNKNKTYTFNNLNVLIRNYYNRHVVSATLMLQQKKSTIAQFIFRDINNHATLFFHGDNIVLSQCTSFLSDFLALKNITKIQGVANIKLWATLFNWKPQQVKGQFSISDLSVDDAKMGALSGEWNAALIYNSDKKTIFNLFANAVVNGKPINNITASLLNTADPILSLHIQMPMTLPAAFSFLDIKNIKAKGDVLCDFNMQTPLLHFKKMISTVRLEFLKDKIELSKWDVVLSRLTGVAEWKNEMLVANNLKAELFHAPIFISIDGKKDYHVTVHGEIDPQQLSNPLDFQILKQMHGIIPFYTSFHVTNTELNDFPDMDISLGSFYFFNQFWKNLKLNIATNKMGTTVQLHNDNIAGDIKWSDKKDMPVRASLHYLFLQTSEKHKEEMVKLINPKMIPPLMITINDLKINNRDDGHLYFASEPISNGMAIRDFKINSPLLNLSAKGYWISHHWQSKTMLNGDISSSNLGQFLVQRHLSSRLQNGNFTSTFSLEWPNSPQQFSVDHAAGTVDLKVEKGRILKLDSDTESNLNIARIFNLVSMQTLSHVLMFDNKSIAKKGFPFDYLQGNFNLKQGALYTNDIEMDGSLAKVEFTGKISLSNEKNDLNMIVYPKVSTSVMTLVGMTGGPVVGAAAWLANKIVSPIVGHIMKMDYRVSGTWNNPVIKRVN